MKNNFLLFSKALGIFLILFGIYLGVMMIVQADHVAQNCYSYVTTIDPDAKVIPSYLQHVVCFLVHTS